MARDFLKKFAVIIGFIVGFVGILTVVWVKDVNAAVGGVYQKVAATSLITCYQTNQFITPRQKSDFKKSNISNLMAGSQKVWDSTGTKSVGCGGFVKSLLDDKGVTIPNNLTTDNDFNDFMTNIGYSKGDATGTGKCISFDYTASGYNDKLTTPKLCASSITNMGNGAVNSAVEIIDANTINKKLVNYDYNAKTGVLQIKCPTKVCGKIAISQGSTAWSDVETTVKQAVLSGRNSARLSIGGRFYDFGLDGLSDDTALKVTPYGEAVVEYTVSASEDALKKATGYLVGTQYGSKPVFLDNEHFVLYQNYLLDFFGGNNDVHCNWDTDDQKTAYVKDYHRAVRLYQNGVMKTCYINTKKMANKNAKVGGIDGSGLFGADCDLNCVLSWLDANTMSYTGLESLGIINPVDGANENPSDPTPTPTPGGGGTTNADFDCDAIMKEKGGKVGAMQWILCPSMNNAAYTANWIDKISQDMLEVKTDRYSTNSGTFRGWEVMRNIANVAMVIFLSVIIFSQLTGYGIDNYGIKKMLPRLLVMALIINLSFYICEVAIDLSNIAGVGLRNLFASISSDQAGTDGFTASLLGLFTAFGAAGGPMAAAGAAAASLGWVAILIAALVLVLIIIVALVTLWLMLGLREIIIIACVILSPLAFACFILPNTQNITKKWWSLFKAAIVIFPICGAVAGISYFLKGLAKGGDLGMGVAGQMILFVLPYLVFFLLPMLLKNALAALGKLGGALTSMGQAIRNGGQQIGQAGRAGIQNSQRYKDWSKDRVRRLQQQRADRIMQRYGDGKGLEQRIADARTRANDTNATSGQRRAAQRELQRAEAEQRRFYEAQTTHYNMESEQALAGTAPEVLATRAESRQEALELKNYSDQYSTYTPAQLSSELNDAVDAYAADRSNDSNRMRLQAVMNTIENNNMMSRVMNDDNNKLTSLTFSADNKNDVKLLSQLTGSKDIVASQFGKQMSKPANSDVRDLSMNSFASGTNGKVNLKDAIKGKGSVLVGASDDSLEYIRKHGANAATPDALLNAAGATNEEKELAQIHAMLRNADSNDINLSAEGLAAYGKSTMDELAERAKRDSVFQRKFVAAANQLAKSPELMGKLHENQRGRINEVMKIVNPNDRTFET